MTYTEDELVEQPAINLFSHLGWDTEVCWDESFKVEHKEDHLAFGRETRNDVVLFNRLKALLKELNPEIHERIRQEAIDEMARDRSAMSAIAANEEVYLLLKEGYTYKTSGLMEPDTLIRDNNNQLLRCQNGTETNIQTIF